MDKIDLESLEDVDLESLEQELAKIDPAELRYLSQLLSENVPAVKKIIRNVLEEPIPKTTKKRLRPPLQPKPYQPIAPPRKRSRRHQLLRQFDPIQPNNIRNVTDYQNEILDLYEDTKFEGEESNGRRYKRWRIIKDLNKDLTPKFMGKIRENVRTSFYLRHIYSYKLRNIEDGTIIFYYQNKGSPWMNTYGEAENWLSTREAVRLDAVSIERPNTKWIFEDHFNADVKVVLDRQPLMGTGPLPDWLRNRAHAARGQAMVALDTYRDNMCLWRCIAVHKGARPDRSTEAARGLVKSFFKLRYTPTNCEKTSLDELEKVEMHLNKGVAFAGWLGIRVYVPERIDEKEVVWHLARNPTLKLKNIMTIGIYEEHAFLIKDIAKLAKTYACIHCKARFTQSVSLQRHAERCAQGKTVIDCPGEKVEAPQSAYQKAFYPKKQQASKESIQWLEYAAKHWKIPIHHAMSGHGGERWIGKRSVDGYNHERKLVLQYHGCHWHGCPKCYPDRDKIVERVGRTREELYQATQRRTAYLRKEGYRVIECWACEVGDKYIEQLPEAKTKSYPHAILYDFEAYGDNNQRKEPTDSLTIENVHIPISVSIGDTLEREPTHICEKDPAELIRKFAEELERRGKNIRTKVRDEFMPADVNLLPKDQRKKIEEWCDQVPALGFNSGTYDLNLIKKHFAEKLAGTTNKVRVAKHGNKIMFLLTSGFRFLDIINYLGPRTSYEKWVKAYECETTKSWFPYEWFDKPEKLDYPGLPDYPHWYSKLKDEFTLKLSEWKACKQLFREKGMKTFKDWVCYYNNLDVAPGLEALEKMRNFYTEKGIDIMKDAVSIPGVSLNYLLRGAIERKAELYSPSLEAYCMLKEAVVGGPSLVFTRYHEVGKTRIRSHQVAEPKLCQNILGYDANALYLSTMLRDMPCGKERVVHYTGEYQIDGAPVLTHRLKEGSWFGYAEIDIEIPNHLHQTFEEMCPFFHNKAVPAKAVPEHMFKYLGDTGRKRGEDKKLLGTLAARRILVYAPLLIWYVNRGAVIKRVYRTIDYTPAKIFPWFVEQVTEARRTGDVEKSKALLADTFKLLGNSGYGKLIEALERQTNVIYTKDEKVVDRAMRSAYFSDLDEIGEAYELESRKPRITIRRPFQIGIAVYQLAKLRMLEFYYDFLDRYIDRKDFELIQMDTDSNYLAISGKELEDIVRPELREEFEEEKKNWLAWSKWDWRIPNKELADTVHPELKVEFAAKKGDWKAWKQWRGRIPGLFKQEFAGERMIALCSKCYFADDRGEKQKLSTKGMSKKQNSITWQRFKAALEGNKDMATNRGFRMREGKIVTYEQEKLGLSAYYDKRWVLPDGIHTEPIEYHI